MTNLKEYLTVKEAARFLGISTMTLRRWDNGKKFRAKRHPINNYRLYNRKELETILKEISKK
ncbi:MAG: helix-turn-helix domain-containing protein [Candidatus Omnitrophica bacterium]|nr:helix-turn-helix domain-containing protein [Candidatus Omnitrophota bacterium]